MQPLDDVLVVDATQALVGPLTTQTLGDLGADVIKIENPKSGDLTRQYTPDYNGLSAYFVSLNRNKRSITLDLTSQEGQEILHELLADADVFMQNFSPGDDEKFGADYETVTDTNEDIVYCDVSGYGAGPESPYSDRKSFDIVLQGESGMMSITGTEDQPARVGISICDISAAMSAIYAILAALYHHQRTGEGEYIDLALMDSSFQFLLYHVTSHFATGQVPGRMGTRHPNLMPYQAFATADSYVVVGVVSERHWPAFCRAVNREEWIDDERYDTFTDRVDNRSVLDAALDDIFAERTTEEWVERLREYGVPCTELNAVDDLVTHEHIQAREMITEMEHPDLGTFKAPGNPVNFENLETDTTGPPPKLGEHSVDVLTELGYSAEEIVRLEEKGIV